MDSDGQENQFARGYEDVLNLNERDDRGIEIDHRGWQVAKDEDGKVDPQQNNVVQQSP